MTNDNDVDLSGAQLMVSAIDWQQGETSVPVIRRILIGSQKGVIKYFDVNGVIYTRNKE